MPKRIVFYSIVLFTLIIFDGCKPTELTDSFSKRLAILGKWQYQNVFYQVYINDEKTDEGEETNFTAEDTMTFDNNETVTIRDAENGEYTLFYYFDISNTKITFKNGNDARVYDILILNNNELVLQQDVTSTEIVNESNSPASRKFRLLSRQTLVR